MKLALRVANSKISTKVDETMTLMLFVEFFIAEKKYSFQLECSGEEMMVYACLGYVCVKVRVSNRHKNSADLLYHCQLVLLHQSCCAACCRPIYYSFPEILSTLYIILLKRMASIRTHVSVCIPYIRDAANTLPSLRPAGRE